MDAKSSILIVQMTKHPTAASLNINNKNMFYYLYAFICIYYFINI